MDRFGILFNIKKGCVVIPLAFLVLCCKTSRDQKFLTDDPGERLFPSLLESRLIENRDTIYEGYFPVAENRKLNTKKIKLHIIVIPASDAKNVGSPVFYFQGGPGDAATGMIDYFLEHPVYHRNRDVVLIDFRGTGKSNPLHCSGTQVRNTVQACLDEMFPIDSLKKCYTELSTIADLTQYTTEIAIEDVEEVRQWLGYNTVNVFGQSYGTRACQSYMRQYPDAVRSAVMIGPVPTFMTMPLNHAKDGQRAWDLLVEECKNDSICNSHYPLLKREFDTIIGKLRKNPIIAEYHNNEQHIHEKIVIRHGPFSDLIRSIMYSPSGQRQIPYLIHQASKGNFQQLIEIAISRNSEPYSLADGFYLCVTCYEDVPYIVQLPIDNTYMGSYRIEQQINACKQWKMGKVNENFREPVASDIPAFVIAGMRDPITPPHWADSVTQKMSKAQRLDIPQMAHGMKGLSNADCFHTMINSFFDEPWNAVNTVCIESMQPQAFKIE
jgi:pimeloyl-ACP methyl ester carboxylesterase